MPTDKTNRMPSSRELEDALNRAYTAGDLRDELLSTLAKQCVRVDIHDDTYNTHGINYQREPTQATPVAPVPVDPAQETCTRVVYPHGNDRYQIYGASEAILDQKESALRRMFSK